MIEFIHSMYNNKYFYMLTSISISFNICYLQAKLTYVEYLRINVSIGRDNILLWMLMIDEMLKAYYFKI